MTIQYIRNFHAVPSTAPSFESTGALVNTAYALESTALGRIWARGLHAVRLAESSGVDYHVSFGSSLAVAASTDSILLLGGTVETFGLKPRDTHIAITSVSTTTGVFVNVTLGYGN